jgi:hypothetical protein
MEPASPRHGALSGDGAEQLGRRAARLVKALRPRLQRLAEEARPRVEKAGRGAAEYAREHEDELRGAALRLARARMPLLGPALDALASQTGRQPDAPPAQACQACAHLNPPAARFCNNCGSRLSDQA